MSSSTRENCRQRAFFWRRTAERSSDDSSEKMHAVIARKASPKASTLCHTLSTRIWRANKQKATGKIYIAEKKQTSYDLRLDMAIMTNLIQSLGKVCVPACCLLVCTAPGVLASDVVLQKVPLGAAQAPTNRTQSHLGPQATFALINYNLRDARPKASALYVSSGDDLKLASSMIDDQVATSFGFSAEDKSPTAVIDLGKICPIRRLSAIYSARPGSIDFYVMQSLPGTDGDNLASTVKLDSGALASLKCVGSVIDDGTQGRAALDFPTTSGRYVMLRWTPAAHDDASFTVAEVTAFGAAGGNLLASNGRFSSSQTTPDRTTAVDAKDVPDAKDVKDVAEAPAPAEGPPPSLPDAPHFTFIPYLVPVVPPTPPTEPPPTEPPPTINPHSL
jgi:hypothetical protein